MIVTLLLVSRNIGEDMPNSNANKPGVKVWNESLSPFIRHLFTSMGTLILCVGVLWSIAQPHAEDFIKKTVNSEQFATRLSLDELQRRVNEVLVKQNEQERFQERMKSDIDIIKELQREQRKDIKDLLRSLAR